ncbi:MAG: hypothetical protein ACQEWU_08270 [Bacillota bacterium]|uniref:Small peptidoglycan-associated lipoprotein n=1 Tax=Virgibacillus salarius TaxID=447199 RepID=A0A941DZV3_9BACI|nr:MULTISPECIES: hypothetical protein [Bacillaceae]NAZ10813.1 hypothetical protein [Agaribacter marinus]MBR7798104.1 hypothetical protein [Virgibacillus salarius]MCC2249656.1 hypothetical protein [Virgibacillus sp. AGTR]MDY7044237.1 hypothetical protein [Virgibacillus sp. M23]QRZ16824.1 hypothetical protein JUJ52_13565 [Virgibacillus sp. AGTR]
MRKIRSLFIPVLALFLLIFSSGCQATNATTIDVISFQPNGYNVMFFTNNSNSDLENIYFDAIIEIKAKYPSAFKDVQKEEKTMDDLEMGLKPESPSLVIMKNGKTIEHLSGDIAKNDLMDKLEQIIN